MNGIDLVKKRILDRVPLAELIGEYVSLKVKSGRPMGICPFHNEKTPSFHVFPNNYHCFGCKASGDVITFVREKEGLGFVEALRYLSKKYGIPCDELDEAKRNKAYADKEDTYYKAMMFANELFKANLWSKQGQFLRSYLNDRGFSDEKIKELSFGFAKDDFHNLDKTLRSRNIAEDLSISLYLLKKSEKTNQAFDFFRNKLMIPIHDSYGRVIAFGGRRIGEEGPKYINSGESPLFDKSSTLYGLHRAKDSIRKLDQAIITEGYMDTLQLWNHNVDNAVACMGTALTVSHLKKIKNICKSIVILLDGDFAGENGALKTVQNALAVPEVEVLVATLPTDEDPDSLIRKQGKDALLDIVSKATPIIEFAIKTKLSRNTNEAALPELIKREFLPWLKVITDPIKQAYLTKKLSEFTKIPLTVLLPALNESKAAPVTEHQVSPKAERKEAMLKKLTPHELELIGILFFANSDYSNLSSHSELVSKVFETDDNWKAFIDEMFSCYSVNCSPESRPIDSWHLSSRSGFIKLIQHLNKNKKAFETPNPTKTIEKMLSMHELRQSKKLLSDIKSHLTTNPNDLETLKIVSEITKRIKNLELIVHN